MHVDRNPNTAADCQPSRLAFINPKPMQVHWLVVEQFVEVSPSVSELMVTRALLIWNHTADTEDEFKKRHTQLIG